MARLRRFEHHRFIGWRATMTVYDTDAPAEAALVAGLLGTGDPGANRVSTFGPDTLAEARNRGFRPVER